MDRDCIRQAGQQGDAMDICRAGLTSPDCCGFSGYPIMCGREEPELDAPLARTLNSLSWPLSRTVGVGR